MSRLHFLPAGDGVGEDIAVGVFDAAAGGEAAGKAGDLDGGIRCGELLDVEGGAVAVDVGVGAHDQFADGSAGEALGEAVEGEQFRAGIFEGGDAPQQDVVDAFVEAGRLKGQKVLGLLDDADQALIAGGVAADVAGIVFGEVVADRAVADAGFHVADGVGEFQCILRGLLEQVEGDAFGGPRADAGEVGQEIHQGLDAACVGAHGGGIVWGG